MGRGGGRGDGVRRGGGRGEEEMGVFQGGKQWVGNSASAECGF